MLSPIPSLATVSVFNVTKSYYNPANPLGSAITTKTRTKVTISSVTAIDGFMQIQVSPVKCPEPECRTDETFDGR